ncbi:hypothetical protein [Pedobacter mendelii]|uniref:Uncharacterized protein n=1 Tax=Pedobacter mendelii TaxID=1908240 RepID=A0ABQ2BF63_9SPHI|nr:hypothetical protein [Pedobacter mendelii]GGI24581.1 hypothetical protein GCM10008119_13370 [Pedobacter mendelii]
MLTILDKNTPTSNLLEINVNDHISDGKGIDGTVNKIVITDNDEFWLFIFMLNNNKQIEIRKIKNIC